MIQTKGRTRDHSNVKKTFQGVVLQLKHPDESEPESDREILSWIVCVKLRDDIHNPGETTGQMMELKEHVKARGTGYQTWCEHRRMTR